MVNLIGGPTKLLSVNKIGILSITLLQIYFGNRKVSEHLKIYCILNDYLVFIYFSNFCHKIIVLLCKIGDNLYIGYGIYNFLPLEPPKLYSDPL